MICTGKSYSVAKNLCDQFKADFGIFGNGVRVQTDMRSELFKKAELLSQVYYQENKVGSIMALYTNDLFTIRQVFGSGMIMLIDALFLGVIALYKMFVRNLTLTIIAIIPLACLAVASVFVGRFMKKKFEKRQEAFANLSDFAQENFSGFGVVKAFVKETKELMAFNRLNKNNQDKNLEHARLSVIVSIFVSLLISTIMIIIGGVGSYLVYLSKTTDVTYMSLGDLNRYISYFSSFDFPFFQTL